MKKRSRLFVELVLRSWWTILFFLIAFFVYDQAAKRREHEESALHHKLLSLQKDRDEALDLQQELKREIVSQTDEDWIELVLMQKLGLVPEGQTKVHFVRSADIADSSTN